MTIYHEYNGSGSHRLVVDGKPGPWASYQDPCVHAACKLMAFTDYFGERVVYYNEVLRRDYTVVVPAEVTASA